MSMVANGHDSCATAATSPAATVAIPAPRPGRHKLIRRMTFRYYSTILMIILIDERSETSTSTNRQPLSYEPLSYD